VNKYDLEDGLKSFGVFATNNELYLLMRSLDSDNDALLKYSDFADAVTPKSNEYAALLTKRTPTFADDAELDIVFSYTTKKLFTKLLNALIETEVRNEILRQKLDSRPLFNVYEAFKALDKNDNGSITIDEFKELLLDNGIYATYKELDNLLQKYDKNQDGRVTYSEFVKEITPKSPGKVY